jgi:hypothetical protein
MIAPLPKGCHIGGYDNVAPMAIYPAIPSKGLLLSVPCDNNPKVVVALVDGAVIEGFDEDKAKDETVVLSLPIATTQNWHSVFHGDFIA